MIDVTISLQMRRPAAEAATRGAGCALNAWHAALYGTRTQEPLISRFACIHPTDSGV